MSACEQENGEQRHDCPQVAVVQDRRDVWPANGSKSDNPQKYRSQCDETDIIEGPIHCRLGRVLWEMSGKPIANGVGGLRASESVNEFVPMQIKQQINVPHAEVKAKWLCIRLCIFTNSRLVQQ